MLEIAEIYLGENLLKMEINKIADSSLAFGGLKKHFLLPRKDSAHVKDPTRSKFSIQMQEAYVCMLYAYDTVLLYAYRYRCTDVH